MWFNDNIKYNRRLGVPLNLKSTSTPFERIFKVEFPENEFNIDDGGYNFYAPHNHLDYAQSRYPDPLSVPNWPKFQVLKTCFPPDAVDSAKQRRYKRLWHTTEIHTFFEYRKTEIFEFTGDDDVWVYLNGILAVDVGGVHASKTQSIDLSRDAAAERFNMTVGGIYTFDMFQAERKCEASNFGITTTLSAPCNAANKLNSKLQFDSLYGLSLDKVKKSRWTTLNDDGSFVLTSPGVVDSTSYLWIREPVNIGTGFVISFDFNITDLTEGFAFILQRRPEGLRNIPISGGANFGFKGLSNSLVILFDLCQDRDENETSCSEQQVSVRIPQASDQRNRPNSRTLKAHDSIMLSLKDGERHTVKLDYFFTPPALEVTIDGSLYLRQMPFNAQEAFSSRGAYAGFTATNGPFNEATVTISDFKVFAVDVEASATLTVDFPADLNGTFTRKIVEANGEDSEGFSIQTRDGCKSQVEFGGRDSNTRGFYVERVNEATGLYHNGTVVPNIVPATLEDDNSGKYKFLLRTKREGLYSLHLYYGNPGDYCEFNYTKRYVNKEGADVEYLDVTPFNGSSSSCFFAEVEDAIEVIPVNYSGTLAPTSFRKIDTSVDNTAIVTTAVGLGVIGTCSLLAGYLLIVYRRKWHKDKLYILEGKQYKLDAATKFNPNDALAVTGRQLQTTREAISRFRAQRGGEEFDLSALIAEQDELKQQVLTFKQKLDASSLQEESPETIQVTTGTRTRIEF